MKDIVIVLLLIAIVILVFGAVNQDQRIDFDYVTGTWERAPVFALAAIGAGVTLVVGLSAAAVARARVIGDRHKLERELEQVYTRLRAAEGATALRSTTSGMAPAGGPDAAPAIPVGSALTAEMASPIGDRAPDVAVGPDAPVARSTRDTGA